MGKPWKTNHSNGLLWMILMFFLIEMVPFLWEKKQTIFRLAASVGENDMT